MKNVIKNEKAHGLMKAGLALLLSGSVACGEAPTSYGDRRGWSECLGL